MKRWLKIVLGAFAAGAVVIALAVAGFVGLEHLKFNRAILLARRLPPARFERLAADARAIGRSRSEYRIIDVSQSPFADTGAKYVLITRGRVDLVYYKLMEDEVSIQITPEQRRIELVYPARDGWKVEALWFEPNQSPQHNAGTAPSADEALPPRG